jgi:L-amino acid N-acyltransferase YncA
MPEFRIETMGAEDWPAVEQIYKQGIATQNATFETESPDWESWNSKHHSHSRLVARLNGNIVGWAALSPVSTRRVYAGVAEVSIYVADAARGKGLGKALLRALIEQSELNGIWTLQAGIFPENAASIALHKSLGFREVGRREKIGQLQGIWRDVILLERRSSTGGDARRSTHQVCK